jgi:hypothetical protein
LHVISNENCDFTGEISDYRWPVGSPGISDSSDDVSLSDEDQAILAKVLSYSGESLTESFIFDQLVAVSASVFQCLVSTLLIADPAFKIFGVAQ